MKSTAAGTVSAEGGSVPARGVLIDINIVLDLMLEREPWAADAARLLDAAYRGEITGYLASHSITTIFYLVERARDTKSARNAVADLLEILKVVPADEADFRRALMMGLADFEDAVQAVAALKVGADYVATRNGRDFKGANVNPRTASELIALLGLQR